jgi:hypothetical protein
MKRKKEIKKREERKPTVGRDEPKQPTSPQQAAHLALVLRSAQPDSSGAHPLALRAHWPASPLAVG